MSCASRLTRRHLLAAACVAGALAPWSAQAQTAACGPTIKACVLSALASIQKLPEGQQAEQKAALYQQYRFCANDATATSAFYIAAAMRRLGLGQGQPGLRGDALLRP